MRTKNGERKPVKEDRTIRLYDRLLWSLVPEGWPVCRKASKIKKSSVNVIRQLKFADFRRKALRPKRETGERKTGKCDSGKSLKSGLMY